MIEPIVGFKRDDGGRQAAGFKGTTGDCVVRALAIMSDRGYKECYDACASANKLFNPNRAASARNGVNENAWHYVFSYLGFQDTGVKASDNLTITSAYQQFGDCVVEIPRHLLAVKGGYVLDAWDSRFVTRKRRALNDSRLHPKVTQVWRHPSHPMPVDLPEIDEQAANRLAYTENTYVINIYENGVLRPELRESVSRPNLASAKRHADQLYFHGCYSLQGKQWTPLPFSGYFKESNTITMTLEEVTP